MTTQIQALKFSLWSQQGDPAVKPLRIYYLSILKLHVLHEPRTQLIRLSTEFAHGLKNTQQVKDELHAIYCNSSAYPTGVYGEADQKFWNLISFLAELLPNSKYIWLIRDGRDVVASSYGRGWFDSEEISKGNPVSRKLVDRWKHYRLNGAQCGCFTETEWERLTAFERNCWYWSYVNTRIETQLQALPRDRWTMVKLEDMEARTGDLLTWLGLENEKVQLKLVNAARYPIKKWDQWSDKERAVFDQWCGPEMRRWYPTQYQEFFSLDNQF